MELAIEVESKFLDMSYKLDRQFVEQKKEFAKFTIDRSLEDRISKLEAKVEDYHERMSTEIQVTSVVVLILVTPMLQFGSLCSPRRPNTKKMCEHGVPRDCNFRQEQEISFSLRSTTHISHFT